MCNCCYATFTVTPTMLTQTCLCYSKYRHRKCLTPSNACFHHLLVVGFLVFLFFFSSSCLSQNYKQDINNSIRATQRTLYYVLAKKNNVTLVIAVKQSMYTILCFSQEQCNTNNSKIKNPQYCVLTTLSQHH